MVRKKVILFVCLAISFVLIASAFFSLGIFDSIINKDIFTGKSISETLDILNNQQEVIESVVLEEYLPKTENKEEIFLGKKFKDDGRYIISSLNEYSAEWYPTNSPKSDFKRLVVELQITDKSNWKNFSIKGTADIPKYYSGSFDFDTNQEDFVVFHDINPDFVWEYSEDYEFVSVEKKEETKFEEDRIKSKTFVKEKKFNNYKKLDSNIKDKIPKELFLDPDVSACGTLAGGATYDLTTSVSSTGTCFTIYEPNVILDCHNNWINFSSGGAASTFGVYSEEANTTIRNCKIRFANSTSTNSGIFAVYAYYHSNYTTLFNNFVNGSRRIAVYVADSSFSNITRNVFVSNDNYGILFENGFHGVLRENNVTSILENAFYLSGGSNNTLIKNIAISTSAISLMLDSFSNSNFFNNTVRTGSSDYGTVMLASSNNAFTGHSSNGTRAVYIYSGSSNNIFRDCVSLSGTSYDVYVSSSGTNPNQTFVNCSYDAEYVSGASNYLTRKWYYQAYVNDTGGSAVSAANVTAYNSSGRIQFTAQTNPSGLIIKQEAIDYVNLNGVKSFYSNYLIHANKSGYTNDTNTINFTLTQNKVNDFFTLTSSGVACGTLSSAGTTYTLTGNVSSSGTCFDINAANIVLDCNGYWITYGSSAGEYHGVYTDQFNSTIKNCNIYNANRTTGYWGSSGIYLSGSTNSTVFKNFVNNSNSAGIYLANADYNNLTSNFGWTAGSSQGIRLDSSDRNILINNTGMSYSNEAMALSGNSAYNVLINNTGKAVTGRGLFFWQGSHNNTIIGMNASGGDGIRFNNASNNLIRDCIYIHGTNYDVTDDANLGSTGNVLLNCPYSTEYISTSNSLIRQWYYQAYVNESGGSAVSSANITGKNSAGVIQFTENTNSSGWIQKQNATEYINNGGTRSFYNNYIIHANKSGYTNDTNSINFTLTQNKINDFFTLTSTGGDTTSPTISFESPTPDNSSTTSNPITIVANISDASNTSSWIDLDRSLVGYWAMDYYNSTGVYDNSTYNHLATFYAGTTSSDLVDGIRGNAFDFDGGASNEGLIAYGLGAKTNQIFNSSGQLTFSFWVYPDVLANGTMGTNTVRVHFLSGGQIHITMVNKTTNYNQFDSSGVVSLGQWNHVALTYNRSNGNASSYHNGVLVGSKIILNANLTTTSDYFTIGTNWGDPFNGAMDEVMAFNRTLSQVEIRALYSSQINKFNSSAMSLADGQHKYIIYAIDEAGNTANSGLRNFIIGAGDSIAPTITFESPTPSNGSTTSSPVTIVANISDASNTSSWIDLDRSLLGYWAMDYYNSTGVYDNSSWNNFGVFTGGLDSSDSSTGVRGDSFSFDGTSTSLTVSTSNFDYVGNLTISVWVYPTSIATDYTRLIHKADTTGATKGFGIVQGIDSRLVGFYQNSYYPTGEYMAGTGILSDNQWYHVVMTYSTLDNGVNMYVNGANASASYAEDWAAGTGNYFSIGKRAGQDNAYFSGSLDEILIVNRTLSQAEIKALYSSQINKFNSSSISLADGQHNYTVYAIDEYANTANSGSRNFIIGADDSTSPIISFESPTPDNSSTTSSPVTIVANISDASNTSSWIDLDRSLVGYWAMDYVNSTGVYDNSSWNNFGTFNGGQSVSDIISGVRGDALDFDGNDYVLVPNSGSVNASGNLTISLWVYPVNLGVDRQGLVYKHYNNEYELIMEASGKIEFYHGDGTWEELTEPGSMVVSEDTWSFISVTRDAVNKIMFFYLNGNYLGSDTYTDTPVSSSNPVYLGVRQGSSYYFNGSMDEVMIFNRNFSATEIKALYDSKSNKFNSSAMSLADGQYDYTVYAIDESGNTANSGERNFVVGSGDLNSPVISFESPTPSNGSTTSNPITIVANISDASNTSSWIDLDRSLVGYWAMDYANSTNVFDNSSYKNNATFQGGLSSSNMTTGVRGEGMDFVGDGGELGIKYSSQYNITEGITLAIWMKRTTTYTQTRDMHLLSRYPAWYFYDAYNSGYVRGDVFIDGVRRGGIYTEVIPNDGNWYHIVYTYNSTTGYARMYTNGVQVDSTNLTGLSNYLIDGNTTADLSDMGWHNLGRGVVLDEAMIFSRSLSQSEVKALYNSKSNKFNTSSMNLSDGKHNYTVYAIDEYGNTANSGERNFVLSSGVTCGTISSSGTYVLTSNLTATGTCFTVTAADVTIDCNNFWINFSTGGGAATSGVQSTQLNTTIKNCNIVDGNWSSFAGGSRMGIRYGGSRGLIHNNFINMSNGYAIYLEWAQNNTVTFNRIMSNSSSAFGIDGGNFTDIINNTIKSITSTGAYFSSAHNNNFMNNSIIAGNTGLMLITTSNNTIFNNTLNSDAFGSSEIYSQRNNYINNTIIAEGIYGQGFFSQHSNNTLFRGNTISAGYYGFDSTTNSYNYTLIGNKITAKGGYYAVYIEGDVGSGNHTLINNTLASNTNHAIYLLSSLNNNLINNTATSNTSSGIYLYNSSKNNLTNNNATTTDGYGIYIYSSLNNILISNNATSISQAGMFLSYSNNTSLNFNNASSRYGIGFRIEYSSFNNIINNFGLGGGSMAFYLISSNNNFLKNNTGLSTSFYGYDIENCLNITLLNNNGTSNGNGNGIYLYNTNNSNLTSNRGTSIGLNGIYMYNVFNNNLINNIGVSNANNGIVLMRGFNNLLINNTAIATGAESALNLQDSFNNSIINQIAIANGTSGLERYAVYIESSNNTIFRNCIDLSGAVYDIYYVSYPSLNNTFINCSYNINKEIVQGTGSQLIRKWYYQAYVNYSNGSAASNVNVSAYNVSNKIQFTEQTNSSGWIQRKEVIEYINTGGTRSYYNNYTINASKSSYITDNNIFNFTTQQNKINDFFTLDLSTCTYTSGNWIIDCSENCAISSNYNLVNNNISVIGVGTVTLSGNISNFNKLLIAGQDSSNICTVRCVNGGCFKF